MAIRDIEILARHAAQSFYYLFLRPRHHSDLLVSALSKRKKHPSNEGLSGRTGIKEHFMLLGR